MTPINIKAFGLLLGCVWSSAVLILGIASMITGWGSNLVKLFSTVYIGYKANWRGSFIGAFWGFIDGLISGVVLAWIYNKLVI